MKYILRLLFLICLATSAEAQDKYENSPELLEYLTSYDISKLLYEGASAYDKDIGFKCNEKYRITSGDISIIELLKFKDGDKKPYTGLWKHHFTLRRCNTEIAYNVYLAAKENEKPGMIVGPAGFTLLPFRHLLNVYGSIYNVVAKQTESFCAVDSFAESFVVRDTKITQEPVIDGSFKAWEEEWLVKACEATIPVSIKFKEDMNMQETTVNVMLKR